MLGYRRPTIPAFSALSRCEVVVLLHDAQRMSRMRFTEFFPKELSLSVIHPLGMTSITSGMPSECLTSTLTMLNPHRACELREKGKTNKQTRFLVQILKIKMLIFGLAFILFFSKIPYDTGFWINYRNTDCESDLVVVMHKKE